MFNRKTQSRFALLLAGFATLVLTMAGLKNYIHGKSVDDNKALSKVIKAKETKYLLAGRCNN